MALGALALSVALSALLLWVAPLRFSPLLVGLARPRGAISSCSRAIASTGPKTRPRPRRSLTGPAAYPLAILGLALASLVY